MEEVALAVAIHSPKASQGEETAIGLLPPCTAARDVVTSASAVGGDWGSNNMELSLDQDLEDLLALD